ncbi:MAG: hypothetical protein J6X28_03345 [Bacilli bacterium]|nr:hypothetical protein [Bacilli bacterium]
MRFLNEINNLSEEQMKKRIAQKIERLERKSKTHNPKVDALGYLMDYKPTIKEFKWDGNKFTTSCKIRCFYNNFLPKDMKIVYGVSLDPTTRKLGNRGHYYYMDDQEYLYEFCKYIKGLEIDNIYDFLGYVSDFLKGYLGTIVRGDRDAMFTTLYDHEGNVFKPTKERSIGDFKKKGVALCSEYATMAQNILRLFDFNSYLVIGNAKIRDRRPEMHSYNLLAYPEYDEEEQDYHYQFFLMDFINGVPVKDINEKVIGIDPFVVPLERIDQEMVDQLVEDELHLVFPEYSYEVIGDTIMRLNYEKYTRDYYIDSKIKMSENVKSSKEYTLTKPTENRR